MNVRVVMRVHLGRSCMLHSLVSVCICSSEFVKSHATHADKIGSNACEDAVHSALLSLSRSQIIGRLTELPQAMPQGPFTRPNVESSAFVILTLGVQFKISWRCISAVPC